MRTFLFGIMMTFINFSALECDAQKPWLPAEMPENTEIQFNKTAGMIFEYTKIVVSNRTIAVEEKKGGEQTPRRWSAIIENSEQENLYRLFVENRFDTIKNEETKGIVYDAGSEGLSINAGPGVYYSVSYGPNSPLAGGNLKRYRAIADAIQVLRSKYETETAATAHPDVMIFRYDGAEYNGGFRSAAPAELSDEEIGRAKSIIRQAVEEYNAKQTDRTRMINLDGFKYQLIPALTEKNEKQIWVNAFCWESKDWRKRIVRVRDGGNCWFLLYVNLTRNSFDRFGVPGAP